MDFVERVTAAGVEMTAAEAGRAAVVAEKQVIVSVTAAREM